MKNDALRAPISCFSTFLLSLATFLRYFQFSFSLFYIVGRFLKIRTNYERIVFARLKTLKYQDTESKAKTRKKHRFSEFCVKLATHCEDLVRVFFSPSDIIGSLIVPLERIYLNFQKGWKGVAQISTR